MKCCNHDCDQSDRCPHRLAKKTATPPCAANSDGRNLLGNAIDELLDDTGLMLLQGIALLCFVVSIILYASL